MSDLVGNPEDRFSHNGAHIPPVHAVSIAICTDMYFPSQELETLQLGKDWVANLTVKQHGRLDALAVWFDLHLDECVTITTGPDTENCWEQAVYPVHTVQREKDTGEVDINCDMTNKKK